MARRMGKAADDRYMGGGSGNWSRAPKKKKPAAKRTVAKKKAPNRTTAEMVKKMKQKTSALSGAARSTSGKVSPKSGASRSVAGKVKANVKDYERTSRSAPKPSESYKRYLRGGLKDSKVAKMASKTGSVYSDLLKTNWYSSPVDRAGIARGGTYYEARKTAAKRSLAKKRNSKAKKPQSRSFSLGQGPNSPSAKKLKRTVGYGR